MILKPAKSDIQKRLNDFEAIAGAYVIIWELRQLCIVDKPELMGHLICS